MAFGLRRLSLASLLLFFVAGTQCDISHAKSSDKPNKIEPSVSIKKNRVIIRSNPSEVVYRKRFFQADECKLDDGLVILFKDGEVSANVIDKAFMGGRVTGDAMTFRIGNATCEVIIQIQKYKSGD